MKSCNNTGDSGGFSFPVWLRTGRLIRLDARWGAREVKFNPNHDAYTGRFTFADGRSVGQPSEDERRDKGARTWGSGSVEGGGGDYGGGGASGNWTLPNQTASEQGQDAVVRTEAAIARERYDPKVGPAVTVTKNGYTFQVDSLERTNDVKGKLTREKAARSDSNKKRAGGDHRLPDDDGGHFIAARFNGPNNAFNTFAQNANFNRGAYRVMEDGWNKDLKSGKQVLVHISVHYPGRSTRPDSLLVIWTIDGSSRRQSFRNASKGK